MNISEWIPVAVALIGSSGVWTLLTKLHDKRDVSKKMLLGLAHNEMHSMCREYLSRGYITFMEHENLFKYLYPPYKELGGNGSIEKLCQDVSNLPIKENYND